MMTLNSFVVRCMHCGTQGVAYPSFDDQTWEVILDCGQKVRCYGMLFSSRATFQLGGCRFLNQYEKQNFPVNLLDKPHT